MTAGDLYLAALDEWFWHGESCQVDTCDTCTLLINRVRLARKVWQSSQHRSVVDELCEIRELRRALEADAADLWRVTNAVLNELRQRWWITEGRGSYEFDDDRYRTETRQAFEAIEQIVKAVQPAASTRFLDVMRRTDHLRALLDEYGDRPQGDFMRRLGHIRPEATAVTTDNEKEGV